MLYQTNTTETTIAFPGAQAAGAEAHWYAVQTRSNFERQVEGELTAKGIDAYLPQYGALHQWKDRKQKVDIPLFPGYLFARFCDSPSRRLLVLQVRGVV